MWENGSWILGFYSGTSLILLYLVDVAHNHWGEEDLGEGDGHRVHGGHHGGVHEVYGVGVQEYTSTAYCQDHYQGPEDVSEAC